MKGFSRLVLFLTLIVLVVGFFMVLNRLSDIRGEIQTIQLALDLSGNSEGQIISEGEENEPSEDGSTEPQESSVVGIPTAIIFNTMSSPTLQPQTNIAVIVENVSKSDDGEVLVRLKAFTSEASSYSALPVQDLVEIVNLSSGVNQRPADVKGSFSSIPPKSVVSGTAVFRVSLTQRSIILQINADDEIRFYQFNFNKKTYKEIVLG
ncbi:hypothetical protein CL629_00660 [bacterium]|nr:hypothetical protein [bacterium]|tara:strand:+ start:7275 stop:7895 length:621 start_codon:yes stop_codon:yes gene_type:complete